MKTLTFLLWALLFPFLLTHANSTQAETLCDAREVQLRNNFIQIEPTGLDDTANIQCALDLAVERNIAEIRLTRGDFSISTLAVQNFRGTLQGGGKDFTRVSLKENSINCAATTSVITFAGGEPRIRWLSLVWGWFMEPCTETSRSAGELATLLHLTGVSADASSCNSGVISAVIDRVALEGPGFISGVSHSTAVKVGPTVGDSACRNALLGSFKLNRSEIHSFDVAMSLRMRGGATIGIHRNDFINNGLGLVIVDSAATVTVAENRFENIFPRSTLNICRGFGAGILVANSELYSAVTRMDIHGNNFHVFDDDTCPGRGLALVQGPGTAAVSIAVSNNQFSLDWTGIHLHGAYAIDSQGVSGAVISDNQFAFDQELGSDFATSIRVNAADTDGVSGWTIVMNHWYGLNHWYGPYDDNWADIILGDNVSNSLVGPGQGAVVTDYGYDNMVLPQ